MIFFQLVCACGKVTPFIGNYYAAASPRRDLHFPLISIRSGCHCCYCWCCWCCICLGLLRPHYIMYNYSELSSTPPPPTFQPTWSWTCNDSKMGGGEREGRSTAAEATTTATKKEEEKKGSIFHGPVCMLSNPPFCCGWASVYSYSFEGCRCT